MSSSSSSSSFESLVTNTPSPPTAAGPIDETIVTCNMEDLEQANDSQLHTILHDLKQTAFFRTFRVDLSQKCPLRSWRVGSSSSEDEDEDDDNHHHDGDEEEFDCPSATFADLDEDAEPLCTVQPDEDEAHDETNNNPGFLSSNALFSLSKDGFRSKEQKQTYTWEQHSDEVVTRSNMASAANRRTMTAASTKTTDSESTMTETTSMDLTASTTKPSDCDQDQVPNLLPNDFWLDLCTRVRNDDPSNVNLNLNPERNTGYNGTHIWTAIYEENCRAVSPQADAEICLEERVLYRLLSGLHASTTLSIAKNYYPPSKRKGRDNWEPNPTYFMQKFGAHPDHVRNLHFSYVVLLRALTKAADFLYHYEIRTGDVVEDEIATVLLRRLLDSSILQSCSSVFSAFDESLMFASHGVPDFSLQHNFKDVFLNISSILDCVQCQQCKLHGKMAMLGYGTALKILFTPTSLLETNALSSSTTWTTDEFLSRNEIVALINTLAKFSESIRHVRELTHLYLEQLDQEEKAAGKQHDLVQPQKQQGTTAVPSSPPVIASTFPESIEAAEHAILSVATVDLAVSAIAYLARQGLITPEREMQLIQMALARNPELLILARHYGVGGAGDAAATKFAQLVQQLPISSSNGGVAVVDHQSKPDAIVIGSGLAGMAATLNILDRGGKVILLEKEHLLGGNSNKASSGINACCPDEEEDPNNEDSIDIFRNDTTRSAGASVRPDLIDVLVRNSGQAVSWLRNRVGVDLSLKAQLGGHSAKRTHRPSNGMAGAEIIYGLQKAVKAYQASGQVIIKTDCQVTSLLTEPSPDGSGVDRVVGVEYVQHQVGKENNKGNAVGSETLKLYADNVILATGGFAADRSPGSYLAQYRPELLKMPTTAGAFSTGDGITLATALGANRVDMDKVQVHPTGWVDPAEPDKTSKILAAELMRGVGGILINDQGQRFCNELGTRAYVTDAMLSHNPEYARTKEWNLEASIPTFSLVLSSSAALDGKKHVDLYTHKGLFTKLEGVTALAKWMKQPKSVVVATLQKYQKAAKVGVDEFGKTSFRGVFAEDLEKETFYAGTVTPVLHYCMGGITIDTQGNVLNEQGQVIPGLHAAGEVTGGVHGANRLAGNSLLECTVFGTIVGQKIPIQSKQQQQQYQSTLMAEGAASTSDGACSVPEQKEQQTRISPSELAQHNRPDDCWVAINGIVYDLTSFAEEHPAGPESIHVLAGKDGSNAFAAVHNQGILDEVQDDIVGIFVQEEVDNDNNTVAATRATRDKDESNNSNKKDLNEEEDCASSQEEPSDPPSPQPPSGGDDDDDEMASNNTKRGILAMIGWKP
ncbi:hypothetical protein ACA910_004251 [Epithemia clementina (nom. ined.)]